MEKMRNAYKILVGKPEGKRSLGRPTRRCGDNIMMDLRKTGWEGVEWMRPALDRNQRWALVNTIMGNFLTS
jgi:hypothetical protein